MLQSQHFIQLITDHTTQSCQNCCCRAFPLENRGNDRKRSNIKGYYFEPNFEHGPIGTSSRQSNLSASTGVCLVEINIKGNKLISETFTQRLNSDLNALFNHAGKYHISINGVTHPLAIEAMRRKNEADEAERKSIEKEAERKRKADEDFIRERRALAAAKRKANEDKQAELLQKELMEKDFSIKNIGIEVNKFKNKYKEITSKINKNLTDKNIARKKDELYLYIEKPRHSFFSKEYFLKKIAPIIIIYGILFLLMYVKTNSFIASFFINSLIIPTYVVIEIIRINKNKIYIELSRSGLITKGDCNSLVSSNDEQDNARLYSWNDLLSVDLTNVNQGIALAFKNGSEEEIKFCIYTKPFNIEAEDLLKLINFYKNACKN